MEFEITGNSDADGDRAPGDLEPRRFCRSSLNASFEAPEASVFALQSTRMDATRIADLLHPFVGAVDNQPLIENISTYIDILLRWNQRINLTAIRDPEQIVTRHFGESLFAARMLLPGSRKSSGHQERGGHDVSRAAHDQRTTVMVSDNDKDRVEVADVGSGAGFPGIPLKLWAPEISLTLIESNHKKATFLRELTRAITLTDINIQGVRVETLPPASFDLVTLRAVERFETVVPTAARLVQSAGRLALLIGARQLERAHALEPQLSWSTPIPIPLSDSRILAIATAPGI